VFVFEIPTMTLGLRPGFARTEDQRDAFFFEDLKGRTRGLERIGGVFEEGPVEIAENEKARLLHEMAVPFLILLGCRNETALIIK
jgi:hypothetical protein